MRIFENWNQRPMLMSSMPMRSESSVPGLTSGTFIVAIVWAGFTSPPGVQGPLQSAGYRVVFVICHCVLVVRNRLYVWYPMPSFILYGRSAVPESLNWVSQGTRLESA